jgi:hypothetical protein
MPLLLEDALGALMQLDPVSFVYRADQNKDPQLGFIAEDVPDLVATSERKGISPMDIIAVLAKVVQQQQKSIDVLEARIRMLE